VKHPPTSVLLITLAPLFCLRSLHDFISTRVEARHPQRCGAGKTRRNDRQPDLGNPRCSRAPELNSLNGSASAFTIIELLTVSSIVAVLAALLFPAFTSAMESNRQTKCLSNLKQIGAAVMLYAGENDGSFPNAVRGPEDNPGTHSAIWQTDLAKYVGAAAKGSRPFGPPARETVWNCPAAEPNRE
jgi:type II secretory pathway pseudopilin PulG